MPATTPAWLTTLVADFGERCKTLLAGPGDREATIRPPLDQLITRSGDQLGHTVVLHSEVRDDSRHVRPDYGVSVDGPLTGYVEVKAPGRSVDPSTFRGHDLRQWQRQRDLPNLIYTNGTEWRLYRDAELVGDPVYLAGGRLQDAGDQLTASPGLESLLRQFFDWKPAPITSVTRLVQAVAPLTRLLRGDVLEQLDFERRAVKAGAQESDQLFLGLASDWRRLLFPDATDERFADGYAQTVTFALLVAASDGIDLSSTSLHGVGEQLRAQHSLMGRALQLLTDQMATDFKVSLELLKRVVNAIDWPRIRGGRRDTYLYLYEDFLEEYDPQLRKESGSYYTPLEVVEQMVRLTGDVLASRLDRSRGFLDPQVTTVDPAMGTGTYLQAILQSAADVVSATDGPGAVPGALSSLAERLIGFEVQTGPYAVAELRTSDLLRATGATPPSEGMRTFVTNTLDDPHVEVTQLASSLRAISDSRRRANHVKASTPVTVVIGNPPYRERAEGEGGWVEQGDPAHGHRARPILEDFRLDGNGRVEYVMKNLYVYFWRWATWKVFDAHESEEEGVVCFISTNGYQRGPGFKGMREYLRRHASEGWVIDVSPEGHRPDVATRVFPGVQQTLSIGIFVRRRDTDRDTPAPVHYVALAGRRADKYAALTELRLDSGQWRDARTGWTAPFTPAAESAWDDFPAVHDLMPWAAPGVKPNRTWVYGPHPSVLQKRWNALAAATDVDEQRRLFKESRDAKVDRAKSALPGVRTQPAESFATKPGDFPAPVRVGYRAFDRQWIVPDARILDTPRPDLWAGRQAGQIFVIEQHSKVITSGPGLLLTALIPDMDHFKGSEGGRALPLLHPNGDPNVAPGLVAALATILGVPVSAEDMLAYVAAVTAHPRFTARFVDELVTPGVRVPITSSAGLWGKAVELGREVAWLHTYGQAFANPDQQRPADDIRLHDGSSGQPLCTVAISELPTSKSYDPDTRQLHIGDGVWEPVEPEVVEYAVGGRNVIDSWFGYRKTPPGGKKSSPLDHVNLDQWPSEWTTELTDLLTVLTRLTALEDRQAELLDRILAERLLSMQDLEANGVRWPRSGAARQPMYGPPTEGQAGEQLMF